MKQVVVSLVNTPNKRMAVELATECDTPRISCGANARKPRKWLQRLEGFIVAHLAVNSKVLR